MKYIELNGLKNKIPIFDTEPLCNKCSYPKRHQILNCKSCAIFNKYSDDKEKYFDRIFSVGEHHQKEIRKDPGESSPDNLTWLILRFKENSKFIPYCVELLKMKILEVSPSLSLNKEDILICSVPDYIKESYKKGEELAKTLSDSLKINYLSLLIKIKEGDKQHSLKSFKEKEKNAKGSFSFDNKSNTNIHNKTILLIDDVVSSLNTVNECAKLLKENGAKEVYVFSLGRNILPDLEKKEEKK